ncbi:hypothetical protein C8R45DRAFT_934206 [Mycena sanguinolenta]|nr:hypothetical protein C8R45DRAFT_934206 [Mycena sanguinolenta]
MSAPEPTLFGLSNSETPALELFLNDPEHFTFDVTRYIFTSGDFVDDTECPLFPVCDAEVDPVAPLDDESFRSVYFLLHPAVVRLLPFLRMPSRISFTSLEYLADLLDSALPAFHAFAETTDLVPRTAAQGRLIHALLEISFHIQEALPSRFNEAWLSVAGRRGVSTWLTGRLLSIDFYLSEFRHDTLYFSLPWGDGVLCRPFPLTPQEHQFFLAYSNQAVLNLTSLICDTSTTHPSSPSSYIVETLDQCRTFFNSLRNATTSKAIDGFMVHVFANSIRAVIGALPLQLHKQEWFSALPAIPDGERHLSDPLWLAWEEFGHVRDAVMPTPHSPTPRPASSRDNSAPPLDLTTINESPDEQVQDPPADIVLSPIADPIDTVPSPPAANSSPPADIVDPVETVPSPMADTTPLRENENKRDRASSPTLRRTTSPPLKKPKSKKTSPAPAKHPVIKTRAPRKSTTPSDEYIPPVEALDKGESEVEDEDDPQADTQRGCRIRVDGLPVRGLGKESQPFVDNSTHTQLPVESLAFALRDYQHVRRRMNHARCTNCVACGVKCTHQGPGLKCAECKCQSCSGCLHPLSHGDFLNIAEDLFPITRYAPSELDHIVVDFTRSYEDLLLQEIVYTRAQRRFALTAHVLGDWMQGVLASYGPQALPGMDLVPESLRGIWRTMLDKCTLALQNETEPELPMVNVPIGTVPETDSRAFLTFLRDLDDRVQADNAAAEQSLEPARQAKQEPVEEKEDGEIIEET